MDKDTVFDYCSRLSEALVNLGEYTEAERLLQTTISFFERSKAVGETHMYMGIARGMCLISGVGILLWCLMFARCSPTLLNGRICPRLHKIRTSS